MCDCDIASIEAKVDELSKKFNAFIIQYELDMRGDKDTSNGRRGVIGEIRDIKTYHKDYPSLLWLLKSKPGKTVGAILGIFMFLMTLYQLGMLKILLAWAGFSIP